VAPGVDPLRVRDAIRAELADDVLVLTRAEFRAKEIAYWDSATPIGYVFSFGVVVGMVVGGIIVYQILFADVNDHLPEYATLKAMGYSNGFLAGVVIQQAVVLAALGFVPAVAISMALYRVSGDATRLPLEMTQERAVLVLGLTVAMCVLSALMALRKVRSADPAEIF
jgi:putative ABC transport system permease protein